MITAGNAQVSLSWSASSGAASYNVKRATVSGGPYTTVGSVNEPREMEEHGHSFNEKWVYRLAAASPDEPSERIIWSV